MRQLIDTLSFLNPPGRLIQVFLFEGSSWETVATAALDKSHRSQNEEKQSILIAAQTAWTAHTFVNCHLLSLYPEKILCLGNAWIAPRINRYWTPAEYAPSEEGIGITDSQLHPIQGKEESEEDACNSFNS